MAIAAHSKGHEACSCDPTHFGKTDVLQFDVKMHREADITNTINFNYCNNFYLMTSWNFLSINKSI